MDIGASRSVITGAVSATGAVVRKMGDVDQEHEQERRQR
jgi:hypothetical protein